MCRDFAIGWVSWTGRLETADASTHRLTSGIDVCYSRPERCYKTSPTSSQWYVNYRAPFDAFGSLALADYNGSRNALSLCAVISMDSFTT